MCGAQSRNSHSPLGRRLAPSGPCAMRAEVDVVIVEWCRESSSPEGTDGIALPPARRFGSHFPTVAHSIFYRRHRAQGQYREVPTKITTRKGQTKKRSKSLKTEAGFEFATVYARLIRIHAGVAGGPA